MRIAHAVIFTTCSNPQCNLLHIHFVDVDGESFAMAPLSMEIIPDVIKDIQDVSYEIITRSSGER
jgi:hypothetical protein